MRSTEPDVLTPRRVATETIGMELDSATTGPAEAYVTFELAGEGYALRITDVDQIIELGVVRQVPAAPAYVAGIMDYGDAVVSVIDLAKKLDVDGALPDGRCVLVVRAQGERVGLIVDEVRDVVHFDPDDVESLPHVGTTFRDRSAWSDGVAQSGDRLWLLLNIEPILSTEDVTPLAPSPLT